MDRPMVECDHELVYMRFKSLHESDLILWDQGDWLCFWLLWFQQFIAYLWIRLGSMGWLCLCCACSCVVNL